MGRNWHITIHCSPSALCRCQLPQILVRRSTPPPCVRQRSWSLLCIVSPSPLVPETAYHTFRRIPSQFVTHSHIFCDSTSWPNWQPFPSYHYICMPRAVGSAMWLASKPLCTPCLYPQAPGSLRHSYYPVTHATTLSRPWHRTLTPQARIHLS